MQKSVDYAEGMRLFAHFMKSERTIGIDLFMTWGNAEARAHVRHLYCIAHNQVPLDNLNGVWVAAP